MFALLHRVMLLVILGLCTTLAQAQSYPSKPIKIVVQFAAGGGTDILARILAQRMSERFGQPVIVENVTGAGGTIGTAAVARAAPDGYTLLLAQPGPNAVAPSIYANLAYDPARDFAPITLVSKLPLFVVVAGSSPHKSLADLVAAGRQSSNLNYASAGNGSLGHLSAELLNTEAKTKFAIIHYRGSAPAKTAVLSGEASFHFAAAADAIPQMKQGQLRALALTSDQRTSLAPEVLTMAEAGVQGFGTNVWYGFVAPANTPRPIIARIREEMLKILAEPPIKERMTQLGAEPATSTPEEFAEIIKADIAKYATVAKAAGIKPQ